MRIALGILLAMTIASIGGALTARAQPAAYIVSYLEVAVPSKNAAATALRQLAALGRKAEGNMRFEVLQNIYRAQQFTVIEAWKDQRARQAYSDSPQAKQARDKFLPLLTSPLDERPHLELMVGPARQASAAAVFVMTHIDILPPKMDEAITALTAMVDPSRSESGNLRYDVLRQASLPNHFTIVEVWRDLTALQAHEQAAHTKKFREDLLPISGCPYDERLYTVSR